MAEQPDPMDVYFDHIADLGSQTQIAVGAAVIIVGFFILGFIAQKRRWDSEEWAGPTITLFLAGCLWPLALPVVVVGTCIAVAIFVSWGSATLGRLAGGWKPAPKIKKWDY